MKVIKNVNALRSNFIPDNLLFRETLIEDIILKINLGTGNILLSGDTGRGKTASVEIAIKRINSSNEIIIPIWINCTSFNSYGSISKLIIETITKKNYNEKGKSRAELFEDLIKVLKTKRTKKLVVIFDEVDKLINKDRDHQQILNPILETIDSNIILISNEIDVLRNLDERLISRLSPEKRFVEQYEEYQIKKILEQRAEISLEKSNYDLEILSSIAKQVYQTSGDIRVALNLLYEVSNLAEKENSRISLLLLEKAKNKTEDLEFIETFERLPVHHRLIIAGITEIYLIDGGYAENKKVYSYYEKTAKNQAKNNIISAVGYRQFEKILNKLKLQKIIDVKPITPKNRKGRLMVSFPLFDVNKFVEKYTKKSSDINELTPSHMPSASSLNTDDLDEVLN